MAMLTEELSHIPTFTKLLKVGDQRPCLHKMLQATVEQKRLLAKLTSPSHNSVSVSNTC